MRCRGACAKRLLFVQLRLESFNLTLPRPFPAIFNESSPDRIPTNVFPFFRVTFALANEMVEKTRLPMRSCFGNCCRQAPFQNAHPLDEDEIQAAAYEQMNVIRHDYITANHGPAGE